MSVGILVTAALLAAPLSGDDSLDFFESRVRPLLANQCWTCHGSELQQGSLRLDSRAAAIKGGSRGPAIMPGNPGGSLLVRAVRHEDLQMPPGGRLSPEQVEDLAEWIQDGARWPRPLTGAGASDMRGDGAAGHWAFRPVRAPDPPAVRDEGWMANEIDAFVLARLESRGLRPAPPASRRALIRRLSFDLTGLPPRPEAVEEFVRSESPDAYAELVDRLIGSERFGEHWARHWMDWVRYCESHGSQGDFELPNAWRYRDYLIRALNRDVPYDQMLREHLAGDLLPQPRVNPGEGLNESALGLGSLRMVEYGYVPVDALDDQVKVVDNQIDVLTKAFQALTVSCARCHDHKFDPIKQTDFYALYGILASSRPGLVTVDSPERLAEGRDQLQRLRSQVRSGLAARWTEDDGSLAALLARADRALSAPEAPQEGSEAGEESGPRVRALVARLSGDKLPEDDPLRAWLELREPGDSEFPARWEALRRKWQGKAEEARAFNAENFRTAWDLTDPSVASRWYPAGPGVPRVPSRDGEFRLEPSGDLVVGGLLGAGMHSGLDSRKYGGILGSPRFRVASDYISLRVSGGNFAAAKLIVENYPIGAGGIHPAKELAGGRDEWVRIDSAYRKGQMAHIELQTLDDRSRPFRFNKRQPDRVASEDGRSNFGIATVVFHDIEDTPRSEHRAMLHLLQAAQPASLRDFERRIESAAREAAAQWGRGELEPGAAGFLDSIVRSGLLPVTVDELPGLRDSIERYRQAEARIPVPRRAPGVLPGTGFDQPLFVRGDHHAPAEPVPRRYLQFLGSDPFATDGSGRLELAESIASERNPLTARVLVNRLWHYLFGRGIVSSVDNFGTTGARPTHPELLDFLASRFVASGWTVKGMLRYMALSSTYRMGTRPDPEALEADPGNLLLRSQNTRRLPAEAIRDAILETSGDLDPAMYGPSVNVYYVGKTEGGGIKGPLDGARRRSVYQAVKRNAQNPFLEIFDAPKPSTTRGRRDATNIPAQSLALLNDPFVTGQASRWADRTLADGAISPRDRAERMFRRALGRAPDDAEIDLLMTSLGAFAAERELAATDWLGSRDLWQDLAQSLFNLKQFIYLR